MSITLNAKGTSVSTFTVGKSGTTISQAGTITPPAASNLTLSMDSGQHLSVVATSSTAIITTTNSQDLHLNATTGGGQHLILNSVRWPTADGTDGQVLVTNGAGVLSYSSTPTLTNYLLKTGGTLSGELSTSSNILMSTAAAQVQNNAGELRLNASAATGIITFVTNGAERVRISSAGDISSGTDNTQTLGTASKRWSTVYAGTGSIDTSDELLKEQITELSEVERSVAITLKGMIKKFKFIDAVTERGAAARWHIGVIAQDVRSTFIAHGLDATHYGIFCDDHWWELDGQTVEEGTENAVKKSRLGIRYNELLAFIISAL